MLTESRVRLGTVTFALTCLLLGACAAEPKPRPARLDPANPAAAESPSLAVNALGGGMPALEPAPPAAEATEDRAGGDKKAASYTCPMDADVVSDKPGRCPKCGMNLVPKTDAPPPKGKK